MQVELAHAPASAVHDARRHYFCSEHCRDRFLADAPGAGSAPGRVPDGG